MGTGWAAEAWLRNGDLEAQVESSNRPGIPGNSALIGLTHSKHSRDDVETPEQQSFCGGTTRPEVVCRNGITVATLQQQCGDDECG